MRNSIGDYPRGLLRGILRVSTLNLLEVIEGATT